METSAPELDLLNREEEEKTLTDFNPLTPEEIATLETLSQLLLPAENT